MSEMCGMLSPEGIHSIHSKRQGIYPKGRDHIVHCELECEECGPECGPECVECGLERGPECEECGPECVECGLECGPACEECGLECGPECVECGLECGLECGPECEECRVKRIKSSGVSNLICMGHTCWYLLVPARVPYIYFIWLRQTILFCFVEVSDTQKCVSDTPRKQRKIVWNVWNVECLECHRNVWNVWNVGAEVPAQVPRYTFHTFLSIPGTPGHACTPCTCLKRIKSSGEAK